MIYDEGCSPANIDILVQPSSRVHAISLNFPQNQLVVIAFIITLYY